MTGLVIEFRCQVMRDWDPAELTKELQARVDAGEVLLTRSCGGRVTAKSFNTEAACPRCGAKYRVGAPNTITRIEESSP